MNIRIVIIALVSFVSFFQCKTPYKLQKKAPFNIEKLTYQDWVGGQIGNSGTVVEIYVSNATTIQPDSLYFQNRIASIDIKPSKQGKLWVANFKKETRQNPSFGEDKETLHGKPIPEAKNFPFKLEANEAILRYTHNEQVYYYKLQGIKHKETLFFPAAKPR